MSKSRLNLSLDQDLIDFAKEFADEQRTSVAMIVQQYFLNLKRLAEGDPTQLILTSPTFRAAMDDVVARVRNGTTEWHSFEDVFGE